MDISGRPPGSPATSSETAFASPASGSRDRLQRRGARPPAATHRETSHQRERCWPRAGRQGVGRPPPVRSSRIARRRQQSRRRWQRHRQPVHILVPPDRRRCRRSSELVHHEDCSDAPVDMIRRSLGWRRQHGVPPLAAGQHAGTKAATRPARTSDDLPLPDAPTTARRASTNLATSRATRRSRPRSTGRHQRRRTSAPCRGTRRPVAQRVRAPTTAAVCVAGLGCLLGNPLL